MLGYLDLSRGWGVKETKLSKVSLHDQMVNRWSQGENQIMQCHTEEPIIVLLMSLFLQACIAKAIRILRHFCVLRSPTIDAQMQMQRVRGHIGGHVAHMSNFWTTRACLSSLSTSGQWLISSSDRDVRPLYAITVSRDICSSVSASKRDYRLLTSLDLSTRYMLATSYRPALTQSHEWQTNYH